MAQDSRALTKLVKAHAGPGGRHTVRAFAELAVDPATGYSPSSSLIGKIIKEQTFKITPQLISALAVGMELDREEVAAAAHAQYIGYGVSDLAPDAHDRNTTVRMAHEPGADDADVPKARAWLAAQESEG
ncbi:hypothetical protein [Streptacidiphilus carbonis]|uniref:hypothetical protein n=1 Tax=Streptacidiphilus carbonis TaxID=105422 RepID=UPI0006948312|nr:hypothetical protein [Streptacidiphilus carbonis]